MSASPGNTGRAGRRRASAGNGKERVQKILARAGLGSRRSCEDLVRQGRVTVNGRMVGLGATANAKRDAIKVDGRRVQPRQHHRYVLLNKPRGCVTTVSDPKGRPTVMDFVPERWQHGLFPVGRLDWETEGLLLLTDDGDFGHKVSHPRHGCRKLYEVKVKGRPDDSTLDRLRAGIVVRGRKTAPCEIRPRRRSGAAATSTNSWWSIRLQEGRTRQIREMFHRVGHPVLRLRRVGIGPLRDPKLPPGACRELSPEEVSRLAEAAA